MAEIHPSMRRLYAAVAVFDPDKTRQVDIASALNESSQRVNNWESRGISKEGALAAQRLLGINATFLLDGIGPELIGQSHLTRITPAMMASAWRTAALVAAQTTGTTSLVMPRDADLVAQALNAVVEERESGGDDGEGVGKIGARGQPSRTTHAGEESGAPSGGEGHAPAAGRKRAGARAS